MSSWLHGLMGKAIAPVQEQSVATLISRVENSSMNEDRRKAISELRSMAENPKHIKAIGTEGFPVLMKRLKNDRQDVDTTRSIIQLLISVMSIPGSELRTVPTGTPQYENIEQFVKERSNASIVLSLLEESDHNIRYFSTKLLTYLLANKCNEIEEAVLKSASHITTLMDLLKKGSEMVRNETLLLLIEITKKNVELQKIIAFEGGFENLLEIIEEEGMGGGGIVVQDCLVLINNLLIGNTSNQNHFREMNNIKKLPKLLDLDQSDHWILTDDKKEVLCLTLTAISALVSSGSSVNANQSQTSHSGSSVNATQSQMGHFGILQKVIVLALSGIKAPTVRIKALWALGDLIRNHTVNREFFEKQDFQTQGGGRVSALIKVSQVIFLSRVPKEELGALHVLKSYLINNPDGQRLFAATISLPASLSPHSTPQQIAQDDLSPGKLISKQILTWEQNKDVAKTYYAANALNAILLSNTGVKEQLLKIPFETPLPGMPIENLLSKLFKAFVRAVQTKAEIPITVSFLSAILTWMDDCLAAVEFFCSIPSNLTFLLELVKSPNANVHIAGLAALIAALCFQLPTTNVDHFLNTTTHDGYFSRLESFKQNSEFAYASNSTFRHPDDESRLLCYDKAFVATFDKIYALVLPRLKLSKPIVATPVTTAPQPQNAQQPAHIDKPINHHVQNGHTHAANGHVHGPSCSHGHAEPGHTHKPIQPAAGHSIVPPTSSSSQPNSHAPTITDHHPATNELDMLRIQVQQLQQEKHLWLTEKQQMISHNNHLQQQLQSLQQQYNTTLSQNTQLIEQITSLQKVSSANSSNELYKTQYEDLQKEHEDLLVYLAEVQQENTELKTRLGIPLTEE